MKIQQVAKKAGISVRAMRVRARRWNVKISRMDNVSENDGLFLSYKSISHFTNALSFDEHFKIIELFRADPTIKISEIIESVSCSHQAVYRKISEFKKLDAMVLPSKLNYMRY